MKKPLPPTGPPPMPSGIAYATGPPRPVRKASPERDFSTSNGITARLLGVAPIGQELENWCWAASTQMMVGYLRSLGDTECPTCGRSGHHAEDITQARQMNRRLGHSEVDCSIERTAGFDYKSCDQGGWPYFFEFHGRIQSTEWASKRHVLEEHGLVLRDGGPRLRLRHRLSDWQIKALNYKGNHEFRRRLDDAEGAALSWEMLTYLLDRQRPVAFTFRYPEPRAGHMRLAVGYAVTPGDKRWVAVADPLPPGTGEVHLIPYRYYRDGPFDGHWRDYWVPPAAKDGSPAPPHAESDALTMGRELVASYITFPEGPPPAQLETKAQKLSADDLEAAFLEAKEGLRAVEAIALFAAPMAVELGMGAAWARAMAPQRTEFVIEDLEPGDLELKKKDFVPVYELTTRNLENWNSRRSSSAGILSLLDRPREVIFAVIRPDQEPMHFFSAVTVRRKKDRWRLSSLGRSSLMHFYRGEQFERLRARFVADQPADREVRQHVLTSLIGDKPKGKAEGDVSSKQASKRLAKQLATIDEELRPKYLISVPELYQLLVAYPPQSATNGPDPHLDDDVRPVYEKTFHRPERCVKKGRLLEVLRDLQSVANDREVMRKK